jgi:sodium pump decarboxylase gamma subunit
MFRNFSANIISSVNPVSLDIDAQSPIDVAAVVVTGLVVVFLALIILILFVWLYGKIFEQIRNNKKKNAAKPQAAPNIEPVKNTAVESTEDLQQEDFSTAEDEIVAAISAVIAQISSEEGVKYRVKSITPVSSGKTSRRNVWAAEGLRQNTNPF